MPPSKKQKSTHKKKTIVTKQSSALLEFSYSYHNKASDWAKVVVTTIFVLLIILFVSLDQIILAGLITLAGLTLAILTTAPAHRLNYQFDRTGLTINHRHWFWQEFRYYTINVMPDDVKITLWPIARLRLPTIIHVPYPKIGQAQKILSGYLPQQQTLHDSLTDLFLRVTRL